MAINFQLQIGCKDSYQVLQTITAQSLPKLLTDAQDLIKQRQFKSTEVKAYYEDCLTEIIQNISANHANLFSLSKFIIYPFADLSIDENFKERNFLEGLLDSFTIIAFSDAQFSCRDSFLNIVINRKSVYGLYFGKGGFNLEEHYIRILKELNEKKAIIPQNFSCMIMRCPDGKPLPPEKIKRVVTDILGTSPYIKPLQSGNPFCFSPTSYIVNECETVDTAKDYIKRLLDGIH